MTTSEPVFDTLFENNGPHRPLPGDRPVDRARRHGRSDGDAIVFVGRHGRRRALGRGRQWDRRNRFFNTLFKQNDDGLFSELTSPFPPPVVPDAVNCLQWIDFDRDNDLDLLMVRNLGYSFVLLNNNGQFDDTIVLDGGPNWDASGGSAFDYDLDGYPDIVFATDKDGSEPRLWKKPPGN